MRCFAGNAAPLALHEQDSDIASLPTSLWVRHKLWLTIAFVGELAGMPTLGALSDHTAHGIRIAPAVHAVHDHFRNRDLAFDALAARFIIDGFGEATQLTI